MAINFLDNIQLNQNQLLGARLEQKTSDPSSGQQSGDIIYNSTSNILKYWNDSAWVSLTADTQGMVSWTLQGDSGSNQTIGNGNIVDWTGGTGISTAASSAGVPKLTITNSLPFNSITLASTTGSNSTISNSGTVTIAAGAGITTTNNASGQVTIAATGSGSMSSFDLDGDSGATQTISDGQTLKIAGGSNIATVASATDTVTVNLDASPSITGLTVTGGGISLGGTGRIQGVDTVTATTDAANKAYVDASVVGGFNVKGGFDADTGEVVLTGTDLYTNTAVAKGDFYIVTVAGNFFGQASTPLTVGDSVLCQSAAASGSVVIGDFAVIQSDTDLATLSTVGIGNANASTDNNNEGISLTYTNGTAKVGFNMKNNLATYGNPIADNDVFAICALSDSGQGNFKVTGTQLKTYIGAKGTFSGTSSSGTSHTFTHNLGTDDVIVQLFDASTKQTVYASADRTSVNVVTVTTAATANIRCVITEC